MSSIAFHSTLAKYCAVRNVSECRNHEHGMVRCSNIQQYHVLQKNDLPDSLVLTNTKVKLSVMQSSSQNITHDHWLLMVLLTMLIVYYQNALVLWGEVAYPSQGEFHDLSILSGEEEGTELGLNDKSDTS